MTESQHDLTLTYDPNKTWAHFLLYTEPERGIIGASLNATVKIERTSAYVQEWEQRLRRCTPNPLHTTMVDNKDIPALFHPCVEEDKESPSAVDGTGCTCYRTSLDPATGMPVVSWHYRTSTGDSPASILPWKTDSDTPIDRWTHHTYAPLGLRDTETCTSLIIDRRSGHFWLRSDHGTLYLLPERNGHGHGLEGASGRGALADFIQQLVESEGQDTSVAAPRKRTPTAPGIEAFLQSPEARRTQELSLTDLRNLAV
ncbi:hypothetical protein [Kitasatospora sp. NBC_01300]|uniref:hypothetical protein n=1 Tax=Kitasatospora sp. NBC_01300 TaxID=2903574 RepID=UPI002F9172D8|nr:hypothetical protein OG556_40555 [Kitasatospora sp. NBC_01300]